MAAPRERTFIMAKPDAVHRGLVGDIIKRFEQKGFKLVAMKFMQVSYLICYLELGGFCNIILRQVSYLHVLIRKDYIILK